MSALHPTVRDSVPRRTLATAVGITWVQAIAMTGAVVAAGRVLDRLAAGGGAGAALVGLAACVLVAAGASHADAVHAARAQARAERTLRGAVLDSALRAGVVAARDRSGALLSLATTAVEKVAHYRAAFLGPVVGSMTTPLLVLAVYALTTDALVAGILALTLIAVPVIIGAAQRLVSRTGTAHRVEQARLTSAFLHALQGLDTLVAARAAERIGADLAKQGERHRRGLMRILAVNQILILVIDAAVSLVIVLSAIALALWRLETGEMTLGGALTTVVVALLLIAPVDLVGGFFYIGIGGRASERALGTQFASVPVSGPGRGAGEGAVGADDDAGAVAEANPAAPALFLDGVTAGWTPDRAVLRDLTLRVERGERVALVGPSGVGKSTVSALLQAHLHPSSGRVAVAGLPTDTTPAAEIRRALSVVEQRAYLFQGTIADNLRIAAPDADEHTLWRALADAGLEREVRAMPDGLATRVGEHGLTLSGGQSQRLAIARAILHAGPILLLDEPTSQVDLAGEAAFLERLSDLAVGRSVLMIAHRPGAILAADRTIELAPGGTAE